MSNITQVVNVDKNLTTLKKGAKVDVIEKVPGGKWAHVKTDKFDGYIALSLLKAA